VILDPSAWTGVLTGFSAISSPELWLLTFAGVFLGMVVGILPGFGPPAAMALLFPLSYVLDPLHAIALLAGLFYGAKYGGAVTSILLGIPGEADAVATMFDGHPLALAGQGKKALTAAAFSSFFGALLAMLGMVLLAPVLCQAALLLSPAGRAGIMGAALVLVILTGPGGIRRNTAMVFLGLLLAMGGPDPVYGTSRFDLGFWQLAGGVDLTALLLGLFGLGDLISTMMSPHREHWPAASAPGVFPRRSAFMASLRGSLIGFAVGLVPCGAGVTASFASHALEKRLSRYPERFGKGAWEGLTGPEASNNAAAVASFAPLLLLGLPTNPIMAALLGALGAGGVVPGPSLPVQQPDFYWGLIFSLVLGNIFLLVLGIGLSGFWARLARLPFHLLWPVLAMLCLTGSYAASGGLTGPIQCLFFGLLAVLLRRAGCSPAPLVLAFVLGPKLELHLLQSLMGVW